MWGNVWKIVYKNALQVSVGHLHVPGAAVEIINLTKIILN